MHLKCTHLEQAEHFIDLPQQVILPAHAQQGKIVPELDERCPSSKVEED